MTETAQTEAPATPNLPTATPKPHPPAIRHEPAATIGALAIGKLAIGQLAIGRTKLRTGQIDELHIARLTIQELRIHRSS